MIGKSMPMRGMITVFLLMLVFCGGTMAKSAKGLREYTPIVASTNSARKLDLAGRWEFRFDPECAGERERWYAPDAAGDWETIPVPGTYNLAFSDKEWYKGVGWYRRRFSLGGQDAGSNRVIFRCLGALIRKKVWINGAYVGQHLFPYTAFEFDLTPHIDPKGVNTIVVMTDNSILERAIPDQKWDGWWFYGGLNRDTFLELRPPVAIARAWMDTRLEEGRWHGTISVQLDLVDDKVVRRAPLRCTLSCEETGQTLRQWQKDFPLSEDETFRFSGVFDKVRAWTPEMPALYRVTLELDSHSLSFRTAFRQIETQDSRILLNGTPITIKGISRHEDFPECGGTVPHARTRKDIMDIKALGCNFLRTAHYTQHPYVYDLCDELGLLVWTEIPAWQTSSESLSDPEVFRTYGEPQIAEMIGQYRHHPSVILWSIGNEFKSEESAVAEYVRKAAGVCRELDPTRLVSFASHRREKDVSMDYVDIIAINEYYGWYYGTIYDIGGVLDTLHQMYPDTPILVSEVGCGAPIGSTTERPFRVAGKDYTEDYQLKFLQTHLEQIYAPRRRGYVAGAAVWIYNDFPDPHRDGQSHPRKHWYVNLKGLTTQEREHKRAYGMVLEFFKAVDAGQLDK